MPTVTIDDTPSEAIVKAANQTGTATDARGRVITFKPFNALERIKFFEAVGAENSRNQEYVGLAALAAVVRAIDGEAIPRPATKAQIEALVSRLDDDGLTAVARELQAQSEQDEPGDPVKNA